jgi:hypothetical protein
VAWSHRAQYALGRDAWEHVSAGQRGIGQPSPEPCAQARILLGAPDPDLENGDLSGCTGDLAAAAALADLAALAAAADELVLLAALAHAVDVADYWEEPDPVDWALRDPPAQDALLPVARAVARSPAAHWWPAPVARDAQRLVQWEPPGQDAAPLSGARRNRATRARYGREHLGRSRRQ